ncbi:MAG: NADP-dependent phosphogluconate dehydrogenase [Egibacteraceae bacterium]
MSEQSDIGLIGLGVMGQNLARNIARNGFGVAVYNRTTSKMTAFVDEFGSEGAITGHETVGELVAALKRPRRIISMVSAGAGTDAVLDEVSEHLEDGDIFLDGGNAHFADTQRRGERAAERGVRYLGVGISGGEEGALHGPSIMPGGPREAYDQVSEILETVAAEVDGVPCCAWLGPDGAGHYVKMVHNGIEYADMQLIAESYDLLRHVGGLEPERIADVFAEYNRGELESFLVEITAEVLRAKDDATGEPLVDVIVDEASQKGTGRWTAQDALELGAASTTITAAVFARVVSSFKQQREAAAQRLAGPQPSSDGDPDQLVEDVQEALYAAKVVAYAQGFSQLAEASEEHGWELDPGTVATIWRDGCIIRARFLDRIKEAFDSEPDLSSLLLADRFREATADAQERWRRVISTAVSAGVAIPAYSAALAYYDGYRRARLPANLVQAQRDYFGAHTYRRLDRQGSFHTRWAQDRQEVPAD